MKASKIVITGVIMASVLLFSGCQTTTRSWGGSMTLELEPGEKLEEITWKGDNNLWYLTRPMRADEKAETHYFKQSSEFVIFEGSVKIIEKEAE